MCWVVDLAISLRHTGQSWSHTSYTNMMSFKIGQAGTSVQRKRHIVLLNLLMILSCSSSFELSVHLLALSLLPSSPSPGEQHLCAGWSLRGRPTHGPLYGQGCYPRSVTAAGDLLPVRLTSERRCSESRGILRSGSPLPQSPCRNFLLSPT